MFVSEFAQNVLFGDGDTGFVFFEALLDESDTADHDPPEQDSELTRESFVRDQAATTCFGAALLFDDLRQVSLQPFASSQFGDAVEADDVADVVSQFVALPELLLQVFQLVSRSTTTAPDSRAASARFSV